MAYKTGSFRVTTSDGERKRIYVRGKDDDDLAAKIAVEKYKYEQGLVTLNSNTPFATWFEEWLATYKKGQVGEAHYKSIESIIDKYFIPSIGALSISEVKTSHLQKCLNEMKGKSYSRIGKARMYIKSVFEKAVLNRMIHFNPALGLEMPAGTEGHRRALTKDEIAAFHAAAEKHHRGDFFQLLLACGLRPGEARALTWFNVDIKGEALTVTQAIEHGTKNTLKAPKSAAGVRTIPIPDWYMPILKKIERSEKCPYVFHNSKNEPITTDKYTAAWRSFKRLMDIAAGAKTHRNKIIAHALDQKISPYYLRHTYATQLAEKGVDIKTAQYLLGHSDIKMTMQIYTHVTQTMLDTARAKINAR